jgi:peptidoglycan/LPS O-acetylase OafA/YrhL
MVFVGVISYSIYLWQQVFFNRSSLSAFTQFPVSVVLAAGAILASYYLVERPCLSLRQNLEKRIFTRPRDLAARAATASSGTAA